MIQIYSAALATAVLFTPSLKAQVVPSDMAVCGFSASAFGIATPSTTTTYPVGSFGGTGAGLSQCILHDRGTWLDFIVGGEGFVGRATATGAGTATYSLITTNVGCVSQMSWDGAGNLIISDSTSDQVSRVDALGNVSDLSVGPQPWGSYLNACAWEPATGDVIAGGVGGLYRLASGATTAVQIASFPGAVSNVQFDPVNGDILATVLISGRLIRVDAAGVVTDLLLPGEITTPNALAVDAFGNYLVGGDGLYRVDQAGGATLLADMPSLGLGSGLSGIAYVRGPCFAKPYGRACPAGLGLGLRAMTLTGDCLVGGTTTATSAQHSGGVPGVAIYGFSALSPGLGLGPVVGAWNCNLYVIPDVVVAGMTDASGVFTNSLATTSAFLGHRIYLQHAVIEFGWLSTVSTSSAAYIQF